MRPDQFADIFVADICDPVEACHEITEAADELRSAVKANYRGRWIGAMAGDDPDKLYKVLVNTPPDWPDVVTVKTKV